MDENEIKDQNGQNSSPTVEFPPERIGKGRLIYSAVMTVLFSLASCFFMGKLVILPFVCGAFAGGFFASLLIYADAYRQKKLAYLLHALSPALVLLCVGALALFGRFEYYRAACALLFYAVGCPVFFLSRKRESKSNITIGTALSVGAVALICFFCFMMAKYGAFNAEKLKELYDSIHSVYSGIIDGYITQSEQIFTAMNINAADYRHLAEQLFEQTVYLLPALFVCACNMTAFLAVCFAHRQGERLYGVQASKPSRTLTVGVPGAFIFGISYTVSAIIRLFADSVSVPYMVLSNLYIIYIPALFLIGIRGVIRAWRSGRRGGKTTGIIMIVMTALDPSLAVTLLAFVGALGTVGEWAAKKLLEKGGNDRP